MRESGLVSGASILDVGCGSGLLACQLGAAGFVVRGAAVVTLAPLARQVSYRTRQPGGVLGNPFLLQTVDAFVFHLLPCTIASVLTRGLRGVSCGTAGDLGWRYAK